MMKEKEKTLSIWKLRRRVYSSDQEIWWKYNILLDRILKSLV